MKKYSLLERDYETTPDEIILVGWDLKDVDSELLVFLEEDFLCEDEKIIIKKITKKEIAYSCSRFCDEEDAHDEGYSYWIHYHDTWKRGLGKCTVFSIEWEKTSNTYLKEKKQ